MEKNLSISNSNRNILRFIPKYVYVFFIFFIITEFCVNSYFRYMTNIPDAKMMFKIRMIDEGKTDKDILIFGDSSAAAIDANEIYNTTGLTAFNFALIGSATLAGQYFVLEKALSKNKRCKYIILMDTYHLWYQNFSSGAVVYIMLKVFPIKTLKIFLNPYFWDSTNINLNIAKKVINHLLPTQRYQYDIRKLVFSIVNERINIISLFKLYTERKAELQKDIIKNNGTSLYKAFELELIKKDEEKHSNLTTENIFHVSKLNRYFLNKFLRAAKKRDIKVFFCHPPILKPFYENSIDAKYIKAYKSFILDIVKENDNAFLLTDDFYVVDYDKLSKTIYHLNRDSAIDFTRLISRYFMRLNKKI
ncbi:MAG: hypothetical protein JW871_06120 [Endomicrobiales bacterium]|nr:hypothetical protein [Endomicrobiales bacterium]